VSVPLLNVQDLSVEFRTRSGTVFALENVCLDVQKGETVGIVGESGSGKSVTAYTVMGILDPAAEVMSGSVTLGGMDMLSGDEKYLQEIRGREISMIFQSPRTALNPIRSVGQQIGDVLHRHGGATLQNARERAIKALAFVRIPDPERRYHAYPFELSGGMCQRVMIAMALSCEPSMLIADEPATGLDVTTQAAIMDLIKDLSVSRNMAALLITHDLGLAAEYCDRIVVMHAGHVVETAPTAELFRNPRHPYTMKLISATPSEQQVLADIASIPGNLPDLRSELPPCRFSARCEKYAPECDVPGLALASVTESHAVACRRLS